MFILKMFGTDQSLYYLSADGTLTPTGAQADTFSVSPDRLFWVAITGKFQFFSADGRSIHSFDLPASVTSKGIGTIVWRPDGSGLFFTYQDYLDYNSPAQLYTVEVSTGIIQLVDVLSPSGLTNYGWVAGTK
jgi:hypothetical protein